MIAILLLLGGCLSTTVQTARTNGAGRAQFGLETGVGAVILTGDVAKEAKSQNVATAVPLPLFNLALRFGILNRWDIGLRIGTQLWEFQTKVLLTPPDAIDRVAVALAPSYRRLSVGDPGKNNSGSFQWVNYPIPVLIEIPQGEDNALIIGPRVNPSRITTTATVESVDTEVTLTSVNAGISLGYLFRVGRRNIGLLPEFGVSMPVYQKATAQVEYLQVSRSGAGSLLTTFNFGVLFGGGPKP